MTDVLLFQTDDDGEINIDNGLVELTNTPATMAYLCLFGGNEDDDGSADSTLGWWGNLNETDLSFRYISETQYLLRSLPATSSNLRRLEDAARRDLSVFISSGTASTVDVSASVPALNKIRFMITIDNIDIELIESWESA